MLLHQILESLEDPKKAILTESLFPYRKSLLTIFERKFICTPILMVVSVTNNSAYAQIVSADEFHEAATDYFEELPEDLDDQIELIASQSMPLRSFAE